MKSRNASVAGANRFHPMRTATTTRGRQSGGENTPHRAHDRPGVALVFASIRLVGGAGAAAAVESDTVPSFWGGLWWALCLMTNLGFVYGRPHSATGAVVSVVPMMTGFLLLYC